MFSIKNLLSLLFVLVCISNSFVAGKKKDESDEMKQAIDDLQLGMTGLKEAASNPALLAQLMQDMADPEMMAEAQKMMNSPEFQKQMKGMANSKDFKDSVKKATDMLKDPAAAAKMEAKMEHMLKVGDSELKKGAQNVMEDAMAAMNNPEVMAEMAKMIKDPNFQQQLASMAKDPQFKNYMGAMQEMMNDPRKKHQMEALGDAVRSSL